MYPLSSALFFASPGMKLTESWGAESFNHTFNSMTGYVGSLGLVVDRQEHLGITGGFLAWEGEVRHG